NTMLTFEYQLFRAVRDIDPLRLVIVEDGYKGIERFTPVTAAKDKAGLIYSVHLPDPDGEDADAGASREILHRADPEDAQGADANRPAAVHRRVERGAGIGRRGADDS